jgi:hypothetical protein
MTSAHADGTYDVVSVAADTALDMQMRINTSVRANNAPSMLARSGREPANATAAVASPLKGAVVDEDGKPVQGATVSVLGSGATPGGSILLTNGSNLSPTMTQAVTDVEGKFEVPSVLKGAALLARKGTMGLLQPVIVDDSNRDVKLVLNKDPRGAVKLHVTEADGKPMGNALIGIRASDYQEPLAPIWGITGPDGSFVLEGAYPYRSYDAFIYVHGYTRGSASPKVEGTKQIDAPPIKLYKADSFITGMVISEQGQPLPNIQAIMSSGKSGARSVSTNAEGRFRFDKIVAGDTIMVRTIGATINEAIQVPAGTENAVIMYVPRQPATPARGVSSRGAIGRAPTSRGTGN